MISQTLLSGKAVRPLFADWVTNIGFTSQCYKNYCWLKCDQEKQLALYVVFLVWLLYKLLFINYNPMFEFCHSRSYMLPCPLDSMSSWCNTILFQHNFDLLHQNDRIETDCGISQTIMRGGGINSVGPTLLPKYQCQFSYKIPPTLLPYLLGQMLHLDQSPHLGCHNRLWK